MDKWYVIQQGRVWSVLKSDGLPNLEVPDGTRRKRMRGAYSDAKTAQDQAARLAAHEMGTLAK